MQCILCHLRGCLKCRYMRPVVFVCPEYSDIQRYRVQYMVSIFRLCRRLIHCRKERTFLFQPRYESPTIL